MNRFTCQSVPHSRRDDGQPTNLKQAARQSAKARSQKRARESGEGQKQKPKQVRKKKKKHSGEAGMQAASQQHQQQRVRQFKSLKAKQVKERLQGSAQAAAKLQGPASLLPALQATQQ